MRAGGPNSLQVRRLYPMVANVMCQVKRRQKKVRKDGGEGNVVEKIGRGSGVAL